MIVCSCNVISSREIEAAVEELVTSDSGVVLTPGIVYRTIGCRPSCGTCLPHVVQLIHAHRQTLETGPLSGAVENTESPL